MSKMIIVEGNSNDKDNVRAIMVKGEKGDTGDVNIEQLNAEVTARTNADTNLQENINSEATTRAMVDRNLQNQISSLASGNPLVANSTSEMTDTTRIYINTTDGNWYYYNGTGWVIGGVYQATEIADESITPYKTTFMKTVKNLWNREYIHGYVLAGDSTNGYYITKKDNNNGIIAIIKIEGGIHYTISKSGGVNFFRMALYENYPIFVEGTNPTADQKALRGASFDNSTIYTVNADQNANYLVVGLTGASYDTEPDDFQVEEGDTATKFNYDYNIRDTKMLDDNFDNNTINISKIKNAMLIGYFSLKSNSVTLNLNEKKLVITNEAKILTSNGNVDVLENIELTRNYGGDTNIIIYDFDDKTVRLVISTDLPSIRNKFAFLGIIRWSGQDIYSYQINGNYRVIEKTTEPTSINLGYKSYDLKDIYLSDTTNIFTPPETRSINDIYDLYDSLMNDYPDYITKDTIGNDSDNNPIYIYKFRRNKENKNTVPNKIITISQIHSFEIRNIYATFLFIKDILDNWQTKPILKSLRFNFDYDVIPLINPWGYLNNTRYNKNDVELNRNFPTNWDDIPEGYHKGSSPLSEVETQALYNYINTNKDKICWFIDVHVSSNDDHWLGSNLTTDLACLNGISNLMACILTEYWPESVTKTVNVKNPADGSLTCYNNSINIHGNILECGYMTGTNYGNINATKYFVTFLGNTLISISKSFD